MSGNFCQFFKNEVLLLYTLLFVSVADTVTIIQNVGLLLITGHNERKIKSK